MIHVDTLVVSLFESNCFIVTNDAGRDCLVIDPGDNADHIIQHIEENGLSVAAHLLTHGHVDHVSALADVHKRFPAPVAMHPADAAWAFTERAAMPPYYNAPTAPESIDRELGEGQTWEDIGLSYRVIETPGHSPGGVAFYFEQEAVVFGGDSLFRGSIGRSDLPGANPRELAASLKKLMELPDETVVYCGHGSETTIGTERHTNPFLQDFSWAG